MRMSKRQWLGRFFPAVFGGKKRAQAESRTPAEGKLYSFPDGTIVKAYTRGEARALLKRRDDLHSTAGSAVSEVK